MLDFHSHILPGLDDGAPDLDTALEMAKIAVAEGITEMVATPHYIEGSMENNRELILGHVEKFQKVLKHEEIPLRILPGCEVYLSPTTPDLLRQGVLMTINDRFKYILVELPMQSIPNYLDDIIFDIKLQGVTPIIAHPERNLELGARPEKVLVLVEKGCLLQLNAGSFTGLYGSKVIKTAELLAENGLVHLLGTDAHSTGGRAPRITEALLKISEIEHQKRKVINFGIEVTEGKPVTPEIPSEIIKQKRSFWEKIIAYK